MSLEPTISIKREPEGTLGYEVKNTPYEEISCLIEPFKLKTISMEHQARATVVGIDQPCWLFAIEMGGGKSKLGLDLITIHQELEGIQNTLIIAPPVVLRHWKREVSRHSNLTVTIVEGGAEEKREILQNCKTQVTVVSLNWFVLLISEGMKEDKTAKWLRKLLLRFDMLIIDEVHTFKNASSKGFKGLREFCLDIPFRYLMTGTPIGNNYVGVFSLYYILDKGKTFGTSFSSFISTYFNTFIVNGRFPKYSLKPQMKAEFIQKYWSKQIRWEEKELKDLPGKTYTTLPVLMTREQQRSYDVVLDNAKLIESDPQFELMRITAGIGFKESPKLDVVFALIEEICIENKRPFILWHWLDEEGQYLEKAIKEKFKKLRMASIRGSTPDKVKSQAVDPETGDWHTGKLDFLLANVKSLGIGVDLYEANVCAFWSNNRSVIDRKQAEKRIHRQGQTLHCQYIDIVAEDSIDEINLKILETAGENFNTMTGDGTLNNP